MDERDEDVTRYAALSRPPAAWSDAGVCKRCRHTLWMTVATGVLKAKSTMSSLCGRRGRGHEVKA